MGKIKEILSIIKESEYINSNIYIMNLYSSKSEQGLIAKPNNQKYLECNDQVFSGIIEFESGIKKYIVYSAIIVCVENQYDDSAFNDSQTKRQHNYQNLILNYIQQRLIRLRFYKNKVSRFQVFLLLILIFIFKISPSFTIQINELKEEISPICVSQRVKQLLKMNYN
ncbi:hypothetical protein pb186bvf_012466 [Paramecium bursaria]